MAPFPRLAAGDHVRDVLVGDGLSFRTFSRGAGTERPAVVLVHGIGVSHRYYEALHARFAKTRRSVRVDLPGFGGRPRPDRDVDVPTMAAALAEVIAGLGLGPVILVGQSMGAQWVVEAARQRPELIARAVVIGPVADERRRTVAAQAWGLARDTLGEPPSISATVFADYIRCGVPWYLAQLRHMLRYRIEERVRQLTRPLLIVRGGNDPIARTAWCRRLRDAAPDARLVVVPGHRHLVQQSAPRAVLSAITADEAQGEKA